MNVIEEIFFGELIPNGNYQTTESYEKAIKLHNVRFSAPSGELGDSQRGIVPPLEVDWTRSGLYRFRKSDVHFIGAKLMAEIHEK